MLKIGIIGSGFGLYGLLPAFNSLENCKVVCICGKRTERLTNYCKKIGLKNIYTDWEEMLRDENLDAVALAVIPSIQYKIAKVAIKKGLHIFGEKPLAANFKQAKELYRLSEKKKIVTAIDFIFPEIKQWEKTKQLIDNKVYGDLIYISANWDFLSYDIANNKASWKTNVSKGGGALAYYFSHSLYYLENFAGKIAKIKSLFFYSKEDKSAGETGVDAVFKFSSGVVGHGHICSSAKGFKRHELIFVCQNATLILESDDSYTENFKLNIYQSEKVTAIKFKKEKPFGKTDDARVKYVRKIAGRFIKACINGDVVKPAFKEGLRVQELIEDIRSVNFNN